MTIKHRTDDIVDQFLEDLDVALRGLPPDVRQQMVEDVAGHIAEVGPALILSTWRACARCSTGWEIRRQSPPKRDSMYRRGRYDGSMPGSPGCCFSVGSWAT